MTYCKVPSIKAKQRRRFYQVINNPEHKKKAKEIQDDKKPPFWGWLIIILLAAFAFLTALSCSPAQKLEISRKWAEKYPDTFTQIADTTFLFKEVPADTIYKEIPLLSVSSKPLKFETPKGLKLQIRRTGEILKVSAENPARVDTIYKIREVFKDPPPPKFLWSPYWKEWALVGFFIGVVFLAIVKR